MGHSFAGHPVRLGMCVSMQDGDDQALRKPGILGSINRFHQGGIELCTASTISVLTGSSWRLRMMLLMTSHRRTPLTTED